MTRISRFNPLYANVAKGFGLSGLLKTEYGRSVLCSQSSLQLGGNQMTIVSIGEQFIFMVNQIGNFFIGGVDGDTIHVFPAPQSVCIFLTIFPKDVVETCKNLDEIVLLNYATVERCIGGIPIN